MKEEKKINVKKNKYLLISIIAIVVILISSTIAWTSWQSKKTALVLTIGSLDDVQVSLSPYELNITTAPVLTYTNMDDYVTIKATNTNTEEGIFNLYYQIDEIDTELASSNMKYAITKSTDNVNFTEYITGDFSSAEENSELLLLEEESLSETSTTYYRLYTYLDGNSGNQEELENKSLVASVYATIGDSSTGITYNRLINNYISSNHAQSVVNPVFTYTGECEIIEQEGGSWTIKLLTSGEFSFSENMNVDIFAVGGGGGGGGEDPEGWNYGGAAGGGGGGCANTIYNVSLLASTPLTVTIGAGGASKSDGGATSVYKSNVNLISVIGGTAGSTSTRSYSGIWPAATGGSGSNNGGGTSTINQGNDTPYVGEAYGKNLATYCENNLATSTCEFGEGTSSGCNEGVTAYAGGGGGWIRSSVSSTTGAAGGAGGGGKGGKSATANTGGGGGGLGAGADGIVIIRPANDTTKKNYTLTYNTNTKNPETTIVTKNAGETIGSLPTPTWSGYTFLGWFDDEYNGNEVSSSDIINSNKTIYAHWKRNNVNTYISATNYRSASSKCESLSSYIDWDNYENLGTTFRFGLDTGTYDWSIWWVGIFEIPFQAGETANSITFKFYGNNSTSYERKVRFKVGTAETRSDAKQELIDGNCFSNSFYPHYRTCSAYRYTLNTIKITNDSSGTTQIFDGGKYGRNYYIYVYASSSEYYPMRAYGRSDLTYTWSFTKNVS